MFHRRRRISLLVLAVLFSCLISTVHADITINSLAPDNLTGNTWFGQNNANQATGRFGTCFTAQATGPVTEIDFWLSTNSGVNGTLQAEFYSTTGTIGTSPASGTGCDGLSTLLDISTNSIDFASLPKSNVFPNPNPSKQQFFFSGKTVATSQTKYIAIVLSKFTQSVSGSMKYGTQQPTDSGQAYVDNAGTPTQGALAVGANDADEFICSGAHTCAAYSVISGTPPSQPGSTVTAPQTCVSCNPPQTPPIDIPTPQTVSQIQPVLSTTSTIDSRPFIIIALLFFLITLFPYLIYHKKSNLSKQYEIRV